MRAAPAGRDAGAAADVAADRLPANVNVCGRGIGVIRRGGEVRPRPTTASTRPPAVTRSTVRRPAPRRRRRRSAPVARASSMPLITSPRGRVRVSGRGHHTATGEPPSTGRTPRVAALREPSGAAEQQRRERRGQARQRRLRLGSPKRTLNSSTRGPSAVSIRPANSAPRNGVPVGPARPARAP